LSFIERSPTNTKEENMATDFYYAKPGPITPIGLPGHKIALYSTDSWSIYKIRYVQPLPISNPLVFNMGAVVAGAVSISTPLANLDLLADDSPELVQLRCFVLDDVEVQISRGNADVFFKIKQLVARISMMTQQVDPCGHTTEIIVLKTDEPSCQANNLTGYNVAQTRLAVYGFKYRLVEEHKSLNDLSALEKLGPVTVMPTGGD
jgi:hypothetical protein